MRQRAVQCALEGLSVSGTLRRLIIVVSQCRLKRFRHSLQLAERRRFSVATRTVRSCNQVQPDGLTASACVSSCRRSTPWLVYCRHFQPFFESHISFGVVPGEVADSRGLRHQPHRLRSWLLLQALRGSSGRHAHAKELQRHPESGLAPADFQPVDPVFR